MDGPVFSSQSLADPIPLQLRKIVYDSVPVEMVHFMLQAYCL